MEQRPQHFLLTDQEYQFLCQYVYEQAGIVLTNSKREMVYRRLTRVIRDRKLTSFSEYCQILKQNPEGEKNYFINAITTNLTSFFREKHHFDYLREIEIPKLLTENKTSKRIRIWSSASSTGEEPYSIAMTIYRAMAAQLATWDVKILATDIDSNVLAHGKKGVYEWRKAEGIVTEQFSDLIKKNTLESKIKIADKVQQLITFKQLNLLHEWPMKGPFDVIFCRNVIIYFDKPTQQDLFSRFYQILKPGGLLLLGHSENLGAFQPYFENIGKTIFRKPILVGDKVNDLGT